jgi:hypothetical protein
MMFECEGLGARESFGKVSVLYGGGESKLGLCGDLEGQNTACARPDEKECSGSLGDGGLSISEMTSAKRRQILSGSKLSSRPERQTTNGLTDGLAPSTRRLQTIL